MSIQSKRVSPKTIEETYTDNDVPRVINEYGCKSFPTYDSSIGFSFDYPMRWLNDKSDFKAVGIRRLRVIPSSHAFEWSITLNCAYRDVIINKYDADGDEENFTHYKIYDVVFYGLMFKNTTALNITTNNTLEEVLSYVCNEISKAYVNKQVNYKYYSTVYMVPKNEFKEDEPIETYMTQQYCSADESSAGIVQLSVHRFLLTYSLTNNVLKFKLVVVKASFADYLSDEGSIELYDGMHDFEYKTLTNTFDKEKSILVKSTSTDQIREIDIPGNTIYFGGLMDEPTIRLNIIPLMQFLNQDVNATTIAQFTDQQTIDSFNITDVWDREVIQVHASFSDNNNGFIGLGGDFYEKPSVLYEPPTNHSNFNIWFTTDGHHRIILRYCRFFIGLCFIRNYNTSLATK